MRIAFTIPNRTLVITAAVAAAFAAGTVVATGFPSDSEALYYSGVLTDSAGAPLTSTATIAVSLFDAANGGTRRCDASQSNVALGTSQGRFRIALPTACADAIAEHGDLWAEVSVGATSLPRQKLGATPYALVARHSQSADAVASDVVGLPQLTPMLRETITGLETEVQAASEHRLVVATVEPDTVFPSGNTTAQIRFGALTSDTQSPEDFDLTTDRFTPQVAGLYRMTVRLRSGNWRDQHAWLELVCTGGTGHRSRAGIRELRAYETLSGTWTRYMAPGDWCQINLEYNFSQAVSLSAADIDSFYSFFEAIRLGN